MTFFPFISIFIFKYEFGSLPKNSGPNPMSFQFLAGGKLTQVLHLPPQPQNSGDAYVTGYMIEHLMLQHLTTQPRDGRAGPCDRTIASQTLLHPGDHAACATPDTSMMGPLLCCSTYHSTS